jgi:site-specific DNA recombinase
MSNALIYARVSSAEQAKGWSPETQLESCRKYAAQHGMTVVGIYTDTETGAILERDGYQSMMRAIRAGEASIVIVHQTDRLHRDLAHAMMSRKELQRLGVELHTVKRGKSGTTPEEQFADNIDDLLSELERAKIIERTNRGKHAKMRQGKPLAGGPAPYGYTYVDQGKDRHLVIDEPAADIVRLIFRWYVFGDGESGPMSVNAIAERLTTMKVPSQADRAGREKWHKKRPENTWMRSHVYPLLNQTAYSGTYYLYQKHWIDKTHSRPRPRAEQFPVESPAIVDLPTWEAAQRRLAEGKGLSPGRRVHEYLLSKRIRCQCGYRVHGRKSSKSGRQSELRLWYVCNGRIRRLTAEPCKVGMPWLRAERLDALVWDFIADLLRDPDRLEHRIEALQKRHQRKTQGDLAATYDDLVARRDKYERANKRILDLYETEEIDRVEWRRRKAANDAAITALTAELETVEQELPTEPEPMPVAIATRIRALAERVRPRLNAMTFDDRRRLFDALDVQVELRADRIAHVTSILGTEDLKIP